ncbi:MAG: PD-(D/E)XK nuclease family protein, partial [Candidatus Rariloculaceae bacterium]
VITGAIDDLWQETDGDYVVVDYKATSKNDRIEALDQNWHAGYKRQMEIYQWLLRRNGLDVSNTGYFVYANGATDRKAFDAQLEFDITLIPYTGYDDWIDGTLEEIHGCLNKDHIPAASSRCDYCRYRSAVAEVTA